MNTRDFQINTVIFGILNQPTFCVLGSLEYNFAIFFLSMFFIYTVAFIIKTFTDIDCLLIN